MVQSDFVNCYALTSLKASIIYWLTRFFCPIDHQVAENDAQQEHDEHDEVEAEAAALAREVRCRCNQLPGPVQSQRNCGGGGATGGRDCDNGGAAGGRARVAGDGEGRLAAAQPRGRDNETITRVHRSSAGT